uniref:SRP-alpha_N domain-containing protein n=1 Tax=Steinernema glaseri TaxID=37863 RepID=A0A1I7ZZD5_9BILA
MIDLFAIFTKGGIVLWCFNKGANLFKNSVNELITEVILQGRGNITSYNCQNQTIKYKLDNEFDLVFLIVYQSAIQLSYGDKFLSEVQIRFLDKYKNELSKRTDVLLTENMFEGFGDIFDRVYEDMQRSSLIGPVKQTRTSEQSEKSKKIIPMDIWEREAFVKEMKSPKKEKKADEEPGEKAAEKETMKLEVEIANGEKQCGLIVETVQESDDDLQGSVKDTTTPKAAKAETEAENIDPQVPPSKVAKRLRNRVNAMISGVDTLVAKLEAEKRTFDELIADPAMPDAASQKEENQVRIKDLIESLHKLQKVTDEAKSKRIEEVLNAMDLNTDETPGDDPRRCRRAPHAHSSSGTQRRLSRSSQRLRGAPEHRGEAGQAEVPHLRPHP